MVVKSDGTAQNPANTLLYLSEYLEEVERGMRRSCTRHMQHFLVFDWMPVSTLNGIAAVSAGGVLPNAGGARGGRDPRHVDSVAD